MSDKFIGSYKVLEKIGAGGMASVYLAVHQDVPNLRVVLKLLSDPRMVERFRAEADKLALLDGHSNICQIKHFFNYGEDFAIAMEYIDGVTLDQIVKEEGRLPVAETVRIITEVLATLEFAHERGVSHRDIKPSNLMIDKQQRVKIIDFGIAKSETDPNLTVAGSSCGTPTYMAPEQFNPSDKINYVLADIYAVGTTLYYLLTGELPFKGDNAFALRDAKLFSDPVRPRDINKDVPRELENIVLKALAKNPEDRFSSATEMRKALRSGVISAEVEPSITPIKPEPTQIVKPPPRKKAGFKPPTIIAVAVVILAAAIYFTLFSGGPSAPDIPSPIIPANGSQVESATPTLQWAATAGENGFYELIYADSPEFVDPKTIGGLTESQYQWSKPLSTGIYYWRVRAMNRDRIRSEFSNVFSFTVSSSVLSQVQGRLLLSVVPQGDIYLNEDLMRRESSNLDLTLDTGLYIIRVENSASTQKTFLDTVTIGPEASIEKDYRFTFPSARPKPPAEEYGYLRIGSRPALGASITIDGERQPHVTPYRFRLKAGRHIISCVLELDGQMVTKTDRITIAPNSDERYYFNFEE